MMKITGLSHLFKWENLHNWWLTKYFFAPLYLHIHPNTAQQLQVRSAGFEALKQCLLLLNCIQEN